MRGSVTADTATPENREIGPIRRLWVACLLGGIQEGLAARARRLSKFGPSGMEVCLLPENERWLMDESARHRGSFNWICDHLGLPADHLRSQALKNIRSILGKKR